MPEINNIVELELDAANENDHPDLLSEDDDDAAAMADYEIFDAPAVLKKKFQVPAVFPISKMEAPALLSRHILFERAGKIPLPLFINNDTQCQSCGCRQHHHRADKHCLRCGQCVSGFICNEQIDRVYFTEFLRWSRLWLKASKKHTITRLKEVWNRVRSLSHLQYCGTCDTPTFDNNMHGFVKRQEGLQCAACHQCSNCCKCLTCMACRRRKRMMDICKACKVCDKCCQCKQCPVCSRDCSLDYCGFSFTDRQKRTAPGCGRCYSCCDCGDHRKVPFGSFKTPLFHKATLKQHEINPTSRYISAEIECAGIHGVGKPIYNAVRRWGGGTVGDGSLADRGFEVNSSPATGDLYAAQINEICSAIKLQNGFLDQRCGLHVHIDARDMNYYDIRRLVRIYAAIEDGLFAMVSPNRIEGITDGNGVLHQYCQPCGKKYIASIEEGRLPYDKIKSDIINSVYQSTSTQEVRYKKRHTSRYNALNIHSWFYRGTIECRMFDGCIDPDPIIKWGILWAMIIDYAVKTSDEEVAKDIVGKPLICLAKIVAGNKNILDFIRDRVLRFGNDQMRRVAELLIQEKR